MAEETPPQDTPIQGKVEFVQHHLPGLDAGEYQIKVSQTVSSNAAGKIPQESITNTYYFAVQGERFALNPQDIFATFPPDQAEGEFDNTLPHVVLTKQTLPWIRYPTVKEPDRTKIGEFDPDVPTWLAVLLFDEDDVGRYPGFSLQPAAKKVSELFAKKADPTTGPEFYSYFYKVDPSSDQQTLADHLDYGESLDDPCQVIDVPLKLFWEVAPSVDDLKLTAHIRHTEITKKATQDGMPTSRTDLSNIPGTSYFAVVFGNRLPATNKHSVACLVSLESLEPFLHTDPATSDTPDEVTPLPTTVTWKESSGEKSFTIDPNGFIRLVCLKSWSFTSTGDDRHFEQLLMRLQPKKYPSDPKAAAQQSAPVSGLPSPVGEANDFSIGLPFPAPTNSDSEAAGRARNALAMGYTALSHHTRDGGQTVSWYRGPLLPYPIKTATLPKILTSADAATCYDPATGMFDLSDAAAWQLGRLLALQDKHFSVALYNWRRGNLRSAVAQMDLSDTQAKLDMIEQALGQDDLLLPALRAFLPGASNGQGSSGASPTSGPVQRADLHRQALTDPLQLAQLIQDSVPTTISSWLARLLLLDGVPFAYLVPDEAMLPPESIRFFYVDMNWVHALLDGALSIGRHATEHSHDLAVAGGVRSAATGDAHNLRATALGIKPSPTPGSSANSATAGSTETVDLDPSIPSLKTMSGFLLRSEVVKGWPGLEVDGYADKDATPNNLLKIVRFERLAPTVLLCMFDTTDKSLQQVDIHEPPEGLHFGVTDADGSTPPGIKVRYNYSDPARDAAHRGAGAPSEMPVPVPFRNGSGDRLIRMFQLAKGLRQNKTYIQGTFDDLPSSEFALQMIKGVGKVSFILSGGSKS